MVEFKLTLCRLQSQLQTIYHGNPMPESTLSSSQGLRIWPLHIPVKHIRVHSHKRPPICYLLLLSGGSAEEIAVGTGRFRYEIN
jgi:hypothetical protein